MKRKQIISAALVAAAILSAAGCKKNESADTGGTKLTWWVPLYPAISQTVQNFSELEFYQELEKKTGVKLEFVHPPVGQENENFNVMIASDELTDLITGGAYPGGNMQAIEDGYYIALDKYIEKSAPNFQKLLNENADFKKVSSEDNGTISQFPFFRGDNYLLSWQGPQIRKDLLDKLNLPLPETIDDWDKTLRAFKQNGIEFPLTLNQKSFVAMPTSMFMGAYGIGGAWYELDGKVHCGFIEDGYKDFLTLLNKWYEDGLLDPDFYAQDDNTHDSKVTSGRAGAWVATGGGKLGSYIKAFRQSDSSVKLSGTKYPVINKGDEPMFGFKSAIYDGAMSVKITSDCKDPEAAVKFLDWGYGDEGHMFWNFGQEGVSYEMVDGYPKYTDLVVKNPDGLDMSTAMVHYMASSYGSAFVQDKRYYEQYLQFDEQRDAVDKWSRYKYSNRMPLISLTEQERKDTSDLETDVNTYIDEMVIKFIVGEESLDNYDAFVQKIRSMGIDKILEAKQNALDRYNVR